jgi:hypothetical protein
MLKGKHGNGKYVDEKTQIIVLSEEYSSYDRYR